MLTKIAGRHSIKVGGDLTRLYYLNNPVYAARPSFGFRNIWDFANDAPYSEGGQFDAATGVPFANRQDNRVNLWGAFVQDDYKIRPNLTINAGIRWSYFGAQDSKENNLDVLQYGSGPDALTGLNIHVGGRLYSPQKNNWGPQLGFAWQPKASENRMVIRGGFGINYNQMKLPSPLMATEIRPTRSRQTSAARLPLPLTHRFSTRRQAASTHCLVMPPILRPLQPSVRIIYRSMEIQSRLRASRPTQRRSPTTTTRWTCNTCCPSRW